MHPLFKREIVFAEWIAGFLESAEKEKMIGPGMEGSVFFLLTVFAAPFKVFPKFGLALFFFLGITDIETQIYLNVFYQFFSVKIPSWRPMILLPSKTYSARASTRSIAFSETIVFQFGS